MEPFHDSAMLNRRKSIPRSGSILPASSPIILQQMAAPKKSSDHGSDFRGVVVLACMATIIGTTVPMGYYIGVVNAPAEFIRLWCKQVIYNRYDVVLTSSQLGMVWATVVSILLAGGALGSLKGAWLANKFGRKPALLTCSILNIVGAIMFICCRALQSIEMLLLGRFLVGLACGITTSVSPMYLSEIAPIHLRSSLATSISLGICFGIIFGQVCSLEELLGTADNWHLAFSIPVVLVILALLPYPWLPESPVYLYVVRKDIDEAKEQLMALRHKDIKKVESEMALLDHEAQVQLKQRTIWSVLTDSGLLLPVVLVCCLTIGQQLSGINAVFFYSVSIFESAGLSSKGAQWANLGAGIVNFVTVCFSPYLMVRYNRRPVVIWSSFYSGICLIILTFVVKFIHMASWLPFASIVAVFAYILAFEIGLGPVPYFIASELFESSPRPAAMAIGSVCIWIGNFVTGMVFPILQLSLGAFVFLPCAVVCFIVVILVKLYLPETRGRDPREIAPLIANGFRSRPHRTDDLNDKGCAYQKVMDAA